MKRILTVILSIFAVLAVDAANVRFNLRDFLVTVQPLVRRTVEIQPQSTPVAEGTNIVLSERRYFNTGTTAEFTATNMVEGVYRVLVYGLTQTNIFRINVPDTSDTTNASAILVPSSFTLPGYAISTLKTNGTTVSASASSLNLIWGTNVVLNATNSSGVVDVRINAAGSVGGAGSLQTNENQFGANTVLTIKDGAQLTNVTLRGTTTGINMFATTVDVADDITAASSVSVAGTLKATGATLLDRLNVTNNANLFGNTVHSGTNIITGVQRFPSIATNSLLFLDGNSNVTAAAAALNNLNGTGAITNGQTVYISASGSDANVGSASSPMATLNAAAERIRGRGTIYMADGEYSKAKLNLALATNIAIIAQGTSVNVTHGSNVTGFTAEGAGLYSFTYITNAWVPSATDNKFIFVRGDVERFIPLTERRHQQFNHDHAMRDFGRLTNSPSLALVGNGGYFVSNNVIFLRFDDGAAPGARTVQLPERWNTNSFIFNGHNACEIAVTGVKVLFGYNAFDGGATKRATIIGCKGLGSYDSGFVDSSKKGFAYLQDCEFGANNNDGVSGTSGSSDQTNSTMTVGLRLWLHDNGSTGWSEHAGSAARIDDSLAEYHITNPGIIAYGGARVTCYGVHSFKNDVGFLAAGSPILYNAAWTNVYTTLIGVNCWTDQCRQGVAHDFSQTQLYVEMRNSWIGADLAFGYTPVAADGVRSNCVMRLISCVTENDAFLYVNGEHTTPTMIDHWIDSGSGVTAYNSFTARTNAFFTGPATNSLLMTGGSGKLQAVAIGANLAFSGGELSGTGGAATTNFNTASFNTAEVSNLLQVAQLEVRSNLFLNTARVTNNATFLGNTVHAGTNIITGVMRFPIIATNSILFIGGESNVVAASAQLNNLNGTGAVTNLFSLTMSNATKMQLVVGAANQAGVTNTTGQIRGLEAGANVTLTENGSNIVIAATAGGGGGTNFPPVIHLGVGTNVAIGAGVRKHVTITTNASLNVNFEGTALNGETVRVGVSNNSTATIYMTNRQGGTIATAYDHRVGSNLNTFAISPNSVGTFEFVWHTNFNQGTMRQELQWTSGKEAELAVESAGANGFLVLLTNAEVTTITLSNAYLPQASSMVLSNLVGVSQYFTNGQASSMVLSNLAGVNQYFTNGQASSMVLSNLVGVSQYFTNGQASSMVLSNLAGVNQYFTNGQASSMVLSNLVGVNQYFTNAQASSMVLSNLAGTGAISNLFSLTASNANIMQLVVGAANLPGVTNFTGQIRGLEEGANITLTENGSNVVITATGGAATTNFAAIFSEYAAFGNIHVTNTHFGMTSRLDYLWVTNRTDLGITSMQGVLTNNDRVWLNERINQVDPALAATFGQLRAQTLVITNATRLLSTNLSFAGTNLVADGNLSSYFTNAIHGRTDGITNIVVTNILDGQTLTLDIWATNGTVVQLCTAPAVTIPAAWYLPGSATIIETNGHSRITVSRYGGWTNVNVVGPQFDVVPNGNVVLVTNFATRTITMTLHPVLTNWVGVPLLSQAVTNVIATNANNVYLRAAVSNAAPVTNWFGQVEVAAASVIIADALWSREFIQTNRMTAAQTIVWTNYLKGAKARIVLSGEAAGGTDRIVTVIPKLGDLLLNYSDIASNIFTSAAITVTNGQILEIDLSCEFQSGTNLVGMVYGRAKR